MFRKKLAALGIEEVISARKWPRQNSHLARIIGSIRREWAEHIIALGEQHIERTLLKCLAYNIEASCHMNVEGNAPEARPGPVLATPT